MFFGELPLEEAGGCLLAHSLVSAAGRIRKGTRLDASHVAALAAAGHERVVVARPDADDVHEDAAARRVARALIGWPADGGDDPAVVIDAPAADEPLASASRTLRLSRASTGRVNVFAERDGLLLFERDTLLAANRVDEGITVATLGENERVAAGRLVATVKIIPYAVPGERLDAVLACLADTRSDRAALALAPIRPRTAALVHTTLPALKETLIDKTSRVSRTRLAAREISLARESRCPHRVDALAATIAEALGPDPAARPALLLIVGASAIGDRRDVVPAAVVAAGGTLERFGLPVDPGNLMLIARIDDTVVLGLPGCARSPRDNGLDRVLDRLACDLPLSPAWLESLALGGLLDEAIERPAPRRLATRERAPGRAGDTRDRVAAVVLAAGASRRAGAVNKLLYPVGGEPMVRRVVRQVLASGVDTTLVVTGHDEAGVVAALDGLDVRRVHNGAHESGMAGSLARGLAALADHDAVLVCLADMPDVTPALIDRLLAAWRAEGDDGGGDGEDGLPPDRRRTIVVPRAGGRRGNPVLIGRAFFDLVLALRGDGGARTLLAEHPDAVREVLVGDEAVLRDHDTLEALRELDGR